MRYTQYKIQIDLVIRLTNRVSGSWRKIPKPTTQLRLYLDTPETSVPAKIKSPLTPHPPTPFLSGFDRITSRIFNCISWIYSKKLILTLLPRICRIFSVLNICIKNPNTDARYKFPTAVSTIQRGVTILWLHNPENEGNINFRNVDNNLPVEMV